MGKTCPACGQAVETVPGLVVDEERGEIRYHGNVVLLTGHHLRLFGILAAPPGRVMTKGAIHDALYFDHRGGEPPADKIIDVFICKLRKQVRPLGLDIKTRWGRGYELEVPGIASQSDPLPITASDMATIQYGGPRS